MRAIRVVGEGGDARLAMGESPRPSAGAGEVRIAVAATAVNRADILQRRGHYPPPPGATPILGLECAGVVDQIGVGVAGFAVGDRVMALLPGGGYAEEAVAPSGSLLAVPPGMSFDEAAAIPESFITAYLNLFELGRARPGTWALVHGGSGGVGTAAIQLLRAEGVRTIVTCGSEERAGRCRDLGAEIALDYHAGPFEPSVMETTDGRGVDVILDCIGARYLDQHLQVLALGGRLVLIGLMGGRRAEIDLAAILTKRLEILGSTLRGRSVEEKAGIVLRFHQRFGERLERGDLRAIVDRILPLDRAQEAHDVMERNQAFGKIVLAVQEIAPRSRPV
jgi:putative PIG3 family NAD(P)H quinone oxidoreductase